MLRNSQPFKFCLLKVFLLVILCFSFSAFALAGINISLPKEITEKDIGHKEKYYWIVYDSVCPYCRSAKKYIKQLDWEGKFKFLSYRDSVTYKLFPSLTKEECEKDVHMITPKGEVLAGYKVFRTVIDNLTATKLLNPLLRNDYAESKLNEIYEKMVKERSCYYNKTDACELDLEKRNKNKED